ncbi:MAG: ACT domain-containing protein [Lachnospiraceae bacterium]|nr:ACT domain-containing protein [Lachnospiraceae bacterium]
MQIEALPVALSVCKVSDYSQVDLNTELCFTAKTEEENSLVYPTSKLPDNILDKEDGWQAMRIMGILDFSYIGIIVGITAVLANHAIGVFVISTFNTDYILVKAKDMAKALEVLRTKGYSIVENETR